VLAIAFLAIQSCSHKKKEENTAAVQQSVPPPDLEIDRLSKLIEANPSDAAAYYQRSKAYIDQKKFKPAFTDINRAIALDSSHADYFVTEGDILFANRQIPQAVSVFQRALALDDKNMDAYLRLAELHLYLKKYQESIQYANEALKIDKHRAKAYFIKGFVYKESGDTAKAISSFQTCVEQEPENYDAFMQLGLLFESKKNKLAAQYYSDALRLNPKSIEALYDRAMYYQETEDFNQSIEDYTAILQIDPNFKDAHYNLGYIHLVYLKVYDQAIRHFTDAIRCDPYFVKAYYNRGLCYEQVGDIAAAAADYKQALSIAPTYDPAIQGLKRVKE